MSNIFEIKDQFYLNGEPFKIISGTIHYFRVVPEYWKDRLEKLRGMGCNTVETYVPWNLHEPRKGEFSFDGMLDIANYIKIAQKLGLWVIVRPSPYICGEWEFGGLPAWLLAEDGMRVRSTYTPFMKAVKDYYRELFKIITPLQVDYGGPIILMQVENEYGAYGDENAYLEELRSEMLKDGVIVPLVTSDGPWGDFLSNGSLDGALPTANFGSKAEQQFNVLKKYNKNRPLMCMEFWVGWFDAWGDEKHHTTSPQDSAKELKNLLSRGSLNFYMFHGGTNFGFMNGSNYYGKLLPDVTSYDYDAPLSENGEITPKYIEFRKAIGEFTPLTPAKFSTEIKKYDYGKQPVTDRVSLFSTADKLVKPIESPWTVSMEKLGQNYGYTLYSTTLNAEIFVEKIQLIKANDRAQIYFDKKLFLTLLDQELKKEYEIDCPKKCKNLDILVENMGRVNYGPMMNYQRKGIDGSVLINDYSHSGWKMYTLPMDESVSKKIDFTKDYIKRTPSFSRVVFNVEKIGDTFLDMRGWGKGCVLVNGFNIGRFWDKGPQKRLYIPAPLLKKGVNELIIFETEGKVNSEVSLMAEPLLE